MPRLAIALRVLVGVLMVGWMTPVMTAGMIGLGLPTALAVAVSLAIAITLTIRLRDRVRAIVDTLTAGTAAPPDRTRPFWLLLFAAAAIVAVVINGRLAVFMADPAHVAYSIAPSDPWRAGHSCFAAYSEGLRFAATGDRNIYELRHYEQRQIGALRVDAYHYPPPFLLLPGALGAAAPGFTPLRAVWFSVQAMALAIGLLLVARWIGGAPGAWAAGASALVLASPLVFQTLQFGNVQITIMALSMVGVMLAYGGRLVPAATLLGYAAVSKIFPGALVVFLLASRRWRAAIGVAVVSVLLVGATILAFGWKPLADFVSYELPRIASGEAFPQTERLRTKAVNVSVYGLTVQLRRLGLTWLTPEAGRLIASLYGFVVIALAALAGWRASRTPVTPEARLAHAQLWLAVLSLASFRSPFVGSAYGYFASLWLLTLLAAGASTALRRWAWMLVFATLAGFLIYTPAPIDTPSTATLAVSAAVFCLALVLNVGIAIRAIARREDAPAPDAAAALAQPPATA